MARKFEKQQILELIDELDAMLQQNLCDSAVEEHGSWNDVYDIHCNLEDLKDLVEEKVN